MNRLQDQVAVVTGAGRGLGRAYALDLAAHGASVVVNDRDREPAEAVVAEIQAAGGTAVASVESVTTMEGAERIVATATDTFGRIDVMVANAGADRRKPALELTADDWAFTLDIHLYGSIYCSVAAGRAMRAQGGGGAIINVASAAFFFGTPTMAPYCVAKGGIYSLIVALSAELAADSISVNGVAPPLSKTGPALDFIDSLQTIAGMPAEAVESMKEAAELPEHVSPIVVFLATEEGRKLSGQLFTLTNNELSVIMAPSIESVSRPGGSSWTLDQLSDAMPTLLGN